MYTVKREGGSEDTRCAEEVFRRLSCSVVREKRVQDKQS
jgi:hypothetical protein